MGKQIVILLAKWEHTRRNVIDALKRNADCLEKTHGSRQVVEQNNSAISVAGGVVGLLGILAAPVSGGLSLALAGASVSTSIGTFISGKNADEHVQRESDKIDIEVKKNLREDEIATEELQKYLGTLYELETHFYRLGIDSLLAEYAFVRIDAKVVEEARLGEHRSETRHSAISGAVRAVGINIAAIESAEKIVTTVKTTEQFVRKTKAIQETINTAKSAAELANTAKDVNGVARTAKAAVEMSQSTVKATRTFAQVAKNSDSVVKTAGVARSVTKTGSVILKIDAVKAVANVKEAASISNTVSLASNGAKSIKTATNVKQTAFAAKTVTEVSKGGGQTIRTTKLMAQAKKISKVTQTTKTAATISKFGLAFGAVSLAIDVYTLVQACEKKATHEDVVMIRKCAKQLEDELDTYQKALTATYEKSQELHQTLCHIFRTCRSKNLEEYLTMSSKILDLPFNKNDIDTDHHQEKEGDDGYDTDDR